jgi:hypothetical protein
MGKAPPNLPERGDRVSLRGRYGERAGVLVKMDDETLWASVEWDDELGPKMAHLYELEKYVA